MVACRAGLVALFAGPLGATGPWAEPIRTPSLLPAQGERAASANGEDVRIPGGSLASRTTQELFELAVQTRRMIKERLLTVDEALVEEHAAFLSSPDTGIVRLLERIQNGAVGNYDLAMGVRGGGAYYSFATRNHSYDAEPDIQYYRLSTGEQTGSAPEALPDEQTRGRAQASTGFSTWSYGTHLTLLIEVGDVDLAEIPTRAFPIPTWVSEGEP